MPPAAAPDPDGSPAGLADSLPNRRPDGLPDVLAQVHKAAPGATLHLDLSSSGPLSGLSAARLLRAVIAGRQRGVTVRLDPLSAEAQQSFLGLSAQLLDPPRRAAPPPWLERLGQLTLDYVRAGRRTLQMIGDLFHYAVVAPLQGQPIKWGLVATQIVRTGADGVAIVAFLSFLIGLVLALNGASQLRQFGAAIYIADLVGVAMTREMAPLITAIIVSGRSGSAITAEIGTMVVSEELDALRTMALPPGRYLLLPRLLGLLVSLPCLTMIADLCGLFGGYWIGVVLLGLGMQAYLDETAQALLVRDVVMGLVKSAVFAVIISLVSCYRGLYVSGGAEGVGLGTTRSVVTSIILCIVANAVFTTAFYYMK